MSNIIEDFIESIARREQRIIELLKENDELKRTIREYHEAETRRVIDNTNKAAELSKNVPDNIDPTAFRPDDG